MDRWQLCHHRHQEYEEGSEKDIQRWQSSAEKPASYATYWQDEVEGCQYWSNR